MYITVIYSYNEKLGVTNIIKLQEKIILISQNVMIEPISYIFNNSN